MTEPIETGATDDIAGRILGIYGILDALAAQAATALEADGSLAGARALAPLIRERLAEADPAVIGIGVAFADGALADAARWLEWWQRHADGEISFIVHDFDERSILGYDYERMPWFARAQASERGAATGPYTDGGGTGLEIVTLGVPLRHGGRTSVVGADLALDALQGMLELAAEAAPAARALVSDRGRVIASVDRRWVPGDRAAEELPSWAVCAEPDERLPWVVILDPEVNT